MSQQDNKFSKHFPIEAQPDQPTEIQFTDGSMDVKNGVITLAVRDPSSKSGSVRGSGHVSKSATRVKKFEAKKRDAGYKREWVDPDTLALAKQLGGIHAIREDRERLLRRVETLTENIVAQEQKIQELHRKSTKTARSWWRLWRS